MSSTDKRIVQMQFDNAQFEAGVSKSMSTLDKLEKKLQFKDSASGLTSFQKSIDAVTFNKMAEGIESLEKRFSAFGIAGMNVVNRLTDGAINAAKRLEQATIGQIKSGGWSRAMNLANAQFQIEGLGFDWQTVLKAVDYGVTDTAYGLDAAAKAASQLAASGVDFEEVIETVDGVGLTKMHKALRAISGVAAMTNSSYEDIARVFTNVAGNGRLMGDQLLQMSSRGLNAAATLAKAFDMTEAEVRDAVSKGMISFEMFAEAMDQAYGEHAKEANNTFTGALSNMKAALSRIGAIFAQPMVDKTNTLFNTITSKIKLVQKALNDVKDNDGVVTQIRFAGHFAEAWETAILVISGIINDLDFSWVDDVAAKLDGIVVKVKEWFENLERIHNTSTKLFRKEKKDLTDIQDELTITKKEFEAAYYIMFKSDGTLNGNARKKWVEQQGLNYERVQKYIDSVAAANWDYTKSTMKVEEGAVEASKIMAKSYDAPKSAAEAYAQAMERIANQEHHVGERNTFRNAAEAYTQATNAVWDLHQAEKQAIKEATRARDPFEFINGITVALKNLKDIFSSAIAPTIKEIGSAIKESFFNNFSFVEASQDIQFFIGQVHDLIYAWRGQLGIANKVGKVSDVFFKIIRKISRTLKGVTSIVLALGKGLGLGFDAFEILADQADILETHFGYKLSGTLESVILLFDKFAVAIRDFVYHFDEFIECLKEEKGFKRLSNAVQIVKDAITGTVKDAVDPAKKSFSEFAESFEMPTYKDVAEFVGKIADKVAIFVEKIPGWATAIKTFWGDVKTTIQNVWNVISPYLEKLGGAKGFVTEKLGGAKGFVTEKVPAIKNSVLGFFTNLGDSLTQGIDKIPWEDVMTALKQIGKYGVLAKVAYDVSTGTTAIINILNDFDGILKALSSFTKSLDKDLASIAKSVKLFAFGYLLKQIVKAIVVVVAAIVILAKLDMPESKINGALDILYNVFGMIAGLLLIFALIAKWTQAKEVTEVTANGGIGKGLKNFAKQFLGSTVLLIASVGLVFYAIGYIVKQLVALAESTTTSDPEALKNAMGSIGEVLKVIATMLFVMILSVALLELAFTKFGTIGTGDDVMKAFIGIAVVMVVIAIIVKQFTKLLMEFAALPMGSKAVARVTDVLEWVALIFGIAAIAMIAFAVIVVAIFGKARVKLEKSLAKEAAKVEKSKQKTWKDGMAIAAGIAAVGFVIWSIGDAVSRISDSFKTNGVANTVGAFLMAVFGVILILGVVALIVQQIQKAQVSAKKAGGKEIDLKWVTALLASVGLLMALMVSSIESLAKTINGSIGGTFEAHMAAIATALAVLVVGMFAILWMVGEFIKTISDTTRKPDEKRFLAIAVIFIAVGLLMEMMTSAINGLAENGLDNMDAVSLAAIFIAGLTAIVGYFLTKLMELMANAERPIKWENLLAIGAMFIEVGAAMLIMAGAISLIAAVVSDIGTDLTATTALFGVIAGVIVLVGLMVVAIVQEISKNKNFNGMALAEIGLIFLEVGAAFMLVAAAIALIASVSDTTALDITTTFLTLFGAILVLIVGGLILALERCEKVDPKGLALMGLVFVEIAAVFLIVAVAVNVIADCFNKLPEGKISKLIGVMVVVGVLIIAIGAFIALMANMTKDMKSGQVDDLLKVGLIFVEIAGALLMIVAAMALASTVSGQGVIIVSVIAGVMIALVAVLIMFADKAILAVPVFDKIGKMFLMIGIGILAASASFLVAAFGIKKIGDALMYLTPLLPVLAAQIEQHKMLFIVIIAMVTVLAVAIIIGVSKIVPAISTVAGSVSKVIETISGGVKKFFSWITGGLKKMAPKLQVGIITLIVTIAAAIAQATPEVIEKIATVIGMILQFIGDTVGVLVDFLLKVVIKILNGLARAIMNNSDAIWNAIIGIFNALLVFVLRGVSSIFNKLNNIIGTDFFDTSVVDEAADALEDETNAIIDSGNAAADTTETLKEFQDTAAKSISTCTGLTDALRTSADVMADNQEKYALEIDAYNDMREAAEKLGAAEYDLYLIDRLQNGPMAERESILKAHPDLLAKYDQSYKKVAASANDAAAKMGSLKAVVKGFSSDDIASGLSGGDLMDSLMGNGMSEIDATSLMDNFGIGEDTMLDQDMLNGMLNGTDVNFLDYSNMDAMGVEMGDAVSQGYLEETAVQFPEATQASMDDSRQVIKDNTSNFIQAAKDLATAAAQKGFGGKDSIERWEKAGEDVVNGADLGIRKNWIKLLITTGQVARSVRDTFNQNLGIESPSKVLAESGRYIDEGIIVGLQDKAADVTKATQGIGDAMIVTFGRSFEDLAAVARGDIPYDMSIRPVMDTSNVARGAMAVDSMFRNQNVSISGISGEIASNIGDLDSRNRDVVEELMQLRSDMGDMTESMTNMQMVLDTGALVGNLSGPMDRNLGRKAIFRKRGS